MSRTRHSVRLPYSASVGSSGTGTIQSDPVKPGQVLVCQSISFRNQTGTRGSAVLKIDNSGVTYPLREEPAPTANEWWDYDTEQHLIEGERVRVDQASCITSDVLDLVIIGYIEYQDDGRR